MNLKRLLSAMILGTTLLISGCGGGSIEFHGTDRAAGVDGEATWEDVAGGLMVELELKHLLPPTRFREDLTTYVVWIVRPNSPAMMESTLEYDDGERTGSAMFNSGVRRFTIIVSAERNAQVGTPSEFVVARFVVDAD